MPVLTWVTNTVGLHRLLANSHAPGSTRVEGPPLPAEPLGFNSPDSAGARSQITKAELFFRTCASTL